MNDITLIRDTLLDGDERAETGRDAARQRLRQAIKAEAAPGRRRWQWALTGTGLTAGAVAAAVVVALGTHPRPAPPVAVPQTAQEFLLAAATQAAAVPATQGKYWHTRWDMHSTATFKYQQSEKVIESEKVTEQWQAAAPGGQSWSSFVPVKNGVYKPKVTKDDSIGYGWENEFTPAEVRALPTDPEALRQTIAAKQKKNAKDLLSLEVYLYSAAVGLLARAPASPAQMAAAYRMLAALPGVELGGAATDSEGRTGVLLRYHGLSGANEVIVDRQTYQVLARVSTEGPFVTQIVFKAREWTDKEPPH